MGLRRSVIAQARRTIRHSVRKTPVLARRALESRITTGRPKDVLPIELRLMIRAIQPDHRPTPLLAREETHLDGPREPPGPHGRIHQPTSRCSLMLTTRAT